MAQVVLTEDGSKTLISSQFQEAYHSRRGALTESLHVFIQNGLEFAHAKAENPPLRVGEIGLGTGLNALLTQNWAHHNQIPVFYTALEPYPLPKQVWKEFEKESWVENPGFYEKLMTYEPDHLMVLNEYFHFTAHAEFWPESSWLRDLDLLYYDAFAPSIQPELWNFEAFEAAFRALNSGGVLVTYCAKGEVKRTMKSVGFMVESLPGPPGKREMTRAIKPL